YRSAFRPSFVWRLFGFLFCTRVLVSDDSARCAHAADHATQRSTQLPSSLPHTPFPLVRTRLGFAPDLSLDGAERPSGNQKASVATHRWRSPSTRNIVRFHSE